MVKEAWVRPETKVQQFVANEYVAVCGMKDGKYIFTCDAPKGTVYYYNSNGDAKKLGGYHPCGEQHITSGTSDYYEGFIDYDGNGKEDAGEHVLVWRERGFLGMYVDYHASASLDREHIKTERS